MAEQDTKVSNEITLATRSLAKMMRGLGQFKDLDSDTQSQYILGTPDENFLPLVHKTLSDFGKVDGITFPENATTAQMIKVIETKAKSMIADEKSYNAATVKALHANSNQDKVALPAMRAYLAGKKFHGKNEAFLSGKISADNLTTDKQELTQIVDFIDKHDEYFENIAKVEKHIAEQNNDQEAAKKAQAALEAREQARKEQAKQAKDAAKVKTTQLDDDTMMLLINSLQGSPEIMGMLNSIVRMFTGGQGLEDLLSTDNFESLNEETKKALSSNSGDTYADLKQTYIDAHKAGHSPEDIAKNLSRKIESISKLSFVKSENGAKERVAATEKALAEAAKDFDINNLEKHADIFAKTYTDEIRELETEIGKPKTYKKPPKELKIDWVGKHTMEKLGEPDLLKEFVALNKAEGYDVTNEENEHLPLIFEKNGAVFMAVINNESNSFTVRNLETQNAQSIMMDNYPKHLRRVSHTPNEGIEGPADSIAYLIKNAKPLDDVKQSIVGIQERRDARNALNDAKLDSREQRKMLREINQSLDTARSKRIAEKFPDTLSSIDKNKDPDAYKAAFKKLVLDRKKFSENETAYRRSLKNHPNGYPADNPEKAKENAEKAKENAEKFAYSKNEEQLILIKDMLNPNTRERTHLYEDAIKKSGITSRPIFYTSLSDDAKTYAVGYDKARGHASIIDVTADLKKLETEEQRQAYKDNPEKMKELAALNGVANMYAQHPDALAVAATIRAKENLVSSFKAASPNSSSPALKELDMKRSFNESRAPNDIHALMAENVSSMGITDRFTPPDIEPENVTRIDFKPETARFG